MYVMSMLTFHQLMADQETSIRTSLLVPRAKTNSTKKKERKKKGKQDTEKNYQGRKSIIVYGGNNKYVNFLF